MTIGKINISASLSRVDSLLRKDKSVSPHVRAMIELLVVIINVLLGKLGINSTNSSTPPSKDPNRTRGSKKKTKWKKRKRGGQFGHQGTTLQKEETPDHIEILTIDRRTIPHGQYTEIGFESRQVIEIEISKCVTEYRAEIIEDIDGSQFVANFPDGVTRPVQYGSSIKEQSVYMSQQQLLPYNRIHQDFPRI